MAQALLDPYYDFNRYEREYLKSSLLADPNIQSLFNKLDADYKLVGAGVVFIDSRYNVVQLREFRPVCRIKPINIIIQAVPTGETGKSYATKLVNNGRESKLLAEAAGAALSCAAFTLSAMVVFSGGVAAPISGGLSLGISALAYTAVGASFAQCAIGVTRLSTEAIAPEKLDWLDSNQWYQDASAALDVIALAGGVVSGAAAIKAYQVTKAASSKSTIDILKGMNRQERATLTKEIIKIRHPGVSNRFIKEAIRSGLYPKRYSQKSINAGLMLHVKDVVGASLGFIGSASSGVVRDFVVSVYEVVE